MLYISASPTNDLHFIAVIYTGIPAADVEKANYFYLLFMCFYPFNRNIGFFIPNAYSYFTEPNINFT